MSLAYQIMYRLGITPWEHREPPAPLVDLVEGLRALPPGDGPCPPVREGARPGEGRREAAGGRRGKARERRPAAAERREGGQ